MGLGVQPDVHSDLQNNQNTQQRDRRAQHHDGHAAGNDNHMHENDSLVGSAHERANQVIANKGNAVAHSKTENRPFKSSWPTFPELCDNRYQQLHKYERTRPWILRGKNIHVAADLKEGKEKKAMYGAKATVMDSEKRDHK